MSLEYDVVDVFGDPDCGRRYSGNQLAVVHGASTLPTETLQAIAQEFGYSETTFPTPRTDGAEGSSYDVRIFTPGAEIPFAGHPTLGTAWVLRDLGLLDGERATQHCPAGEVGVTFHGDGLVELAARPGDCVPLPDAAAHALLADLGLGPEDLAGTAYVAGTGLDFCHVPVTDDAVRRARPGSADIPALVASAPGGEEVLAGLTTVLDAVSVYAVEEQTDPLRVHSRVFVPGLSVPEDPATGSCAAGLGLALRAAGLLPESGRYEIRQGIEMGRPSRLFGRVDPDPTATGPVQVAGRVTRTMRGTLLLDA